jgi:hypothetical protein
MPIFLRIEESSVVSDRSVITVQEGGDDRHFSPKGRQLPSAFVAMFRPGLQKLKTLLKPPLLLLHNGEARMHIHPFRNEEEQEFS